MKFITKKSSNEPKEVVKKRTTKGSTFDDLPKKPLRTALLKEQGFICAYCMKRISNTSKTRIEHFAPRTKENSKNYMNLIAACDGNELSKKDKSDTRTSLEKKMVHCDVLKKNTSISISPLKKSCEQLVLFDIAGIVYSNDETTEKELNDILGLNHPSLVRERIYVLDELKNIISIEAKKNADNKIRKSQLQSLIKQWAKRNKNSKFIPFCRVAINYLEKRISRL